MARKCYLFFLFVFIVILSTGISTRNIFAEDTGGDDVLPVVIESTELPTPIEPGTYEIDLYNVKKYALPDEENQEVMTRKYHLYIPTSYDETTTTPLILDFHGYTFTPQLQLLLSGFKTIADQNGVIVVYPEGIGRSFNAEVCCGYAMENKINDIAYSEAIVNDVATKLNIDTARVYITGYSNGGAMSHLLARAKPDVFAAAAPIAFSKVECPDGVDKIISMMEEVYPETDYSDMEIDCQGQAPVVNGNPYQAYSIPVIIFQGKQEPKDENIWQESADLVKEFAQDWAILNGWPGGPGSYEYTKYPNPITMLDSDTFNDYFENYKYYGDADVEFWLLNSKHAPDYNVLMSNLLNPAGVAEELFGSNVYWNKDLVPVHTKAWEFMSQYTIADHITPLPVEIINNEDDLENLSGVSEINGNLIIKNTSLTNLDALESLTSIVGSLYIRSNKDLADLNGLANLCEVGGDFVIQDNPGITPPDANALKDQVIGCNGIGGSIDVDWVCLSYSAWPIYHRNIGRAYQVNDAIYLNGSNQFIGYWYSTYYVRVHKNWDEPGTWYKGACPN